MTESRNFHHLWHNWYWYRTHGAGAGEFMYAKCTVCSAEKPVRWVRSTDMHRAQIAAMNRSRPPSSSEPPKRPRPSSVVIPPIDFDTPTGDPMVIHRRTFYP